MIFLTRIKGVISCCLVLLIAIHSCIVGVRAQGNDIVLVKGEPSLTESIVIKSTDLIEWSLGISFTPEDRSRIKQILIDAWKTNNRAQIDSTLSAVEIQNQISQMNPADRNNLRAKLKTAVLENLQREPGDEISRVALGAYEASRSTRSSTAIGKPDQSNPVQTSGSSELWTFSKTESLSAERAEEILQQVAPANIAGEEIRPLGLSNAIANARGFLIERASKPALAAFGASPQARDAKRASVAAGGALVANKPLAALAALLRANELEPQNATYLANLAAVLSLIGMSHEALAILDSAAVKNGRIASPLGIGGQAGALNTRGHALVQLGRTKEAEDALRIAVAQSQNLTEAKINLAFALWLQDDPRKKEEARRLIAAVWRRTPRQAPKGTTGKKSPPTEPQKQNSEEIPIELFELDGPTANLDLSKGKRLRLPDLKIPGTLEASVAMSPKYKKLAGEVRGILDRLSAQEERVSEAIDARANLRLNTTVTEVNAMKALLRENVRQHPTVRPYWEKAQKAYMNNNRGVPFSAGLAADAGGVRTTSTDLFEGIPEDFTPEPSQLDRLQRRYREIGELERSEAGACRTGSCSAQVKRKYDLVRCAAVREAHGMWRSGVHDYDTALRNYLQAAYKHMTAVAANIRDREEHELLRVKIESDIYEEWLALISAADSIASSSEQGIAFCRAIGDVIPDDLENLQVEKANYCPQFLSPPNKIKIDLQFVSVSFSCETVGVELSSPWLGLFVEGEANFKGGWISKYQGATIGFGVKAALEIDGVPASVEGKAGGYIKIDKDGNIKDAGLKAGATFTLGTKINRGINDAVEDVVEVAGKEIDTGVKAGFETGGDLELTILPALGLPPPRD